jgi:hypothetical protein
VFDNRVLRRIFGPKSDEVRGEWRKLLNEELYDLYCSLLVSSTDHYLVDQIKKNEMGGSCSIYGRAKRYLQGFGRENPRERVHLEVTGVGDSIILKWIFKKFYGGHGLD